MNVIIDNVNVENGTAAVIFDNEKGYLDVKGMSVSGITSPSVIATGNGGLSFLRDSSITASNIDYVTHTTSTGAQTISGVTISHMTRLVDVFFVEGSGSSLSVSGTAIKDNAINLPPWGFIRALSSGNAQVTNTEFTNNSGVQNGIASGGAGTKVVLTSSSFTGNGGVVRVLVLACYF